MQSPSFSSVWDLRHRQDITNYTSRVHDWTMCALQKLHVWDSQYIWFYQYFITWSKHKMISFWFICMLLTKLPNYLNWLPQGLFSCKNPSLVRDQKNPRTAWGQGWVSWWVTVHLFNSFPFPRGDWHTSFFRRRRGNMMNTWDQIFKIMHFCCNEWNVKNHVLNLQRLKWKVSFL